MNKYRSLQNLIVDATFGVVKLIKSFSTSSTRIAKPEQRWGGSVPPGVTNPWGGGPSGGKKNREGTQGWKLPGGNGPSTV